MALSQRQGHFPPDFLLEASLGNVPGYGQEFVIGVAPDVDTTDGELTIWDNKFDLTRLTSYEEMFISSSSASDTTQTITVVGLGENFEPVIAQAVLNGQNQVSVRNFNHVQSAILAAGSSALNGDVYIAESDTLTGGIPDTQSKIKSKIVANNGITRNGFFMVPAGKVAVTVGIRGTVDTVNKAALATTLIYQEGAVTPIRSVDYTLSSGFPQFLFPAPVATTNILGQLVPVLPEKTFLEFRATAGQNDTRVFFGSDLLLVDQPLVGV